MQHAPSFKPPVPGVRVQEARIGLGIFALRHFAKGRTIGRIGGRVYHWRVLMKRGGAFLANCFRFDDDTYLDPLDGLGRYLNHSCRPNAAIRKTGGTLFLFAAADIKAGTEIVIDYSTITADDDAWRMRCHCGTPQCRKWVGRFGLLPPKVQRAYLERDMVPDVVIAMMD